MSYVRTKNHEEVKSWIEEHGGIPVSLPEGDGEQLAAYFGMPPLPEGYEAVSWEDFFNRFDSLGFSFKYPLPDADPEERLDYQFMIDSEVESDEEKDDETDLLESTEIATENAFGQVHEPQ